MAADSHYRDLFENSADAILIIEGDRFIDCNAAAARMLRFPTRDALLEHYSDRRANEDGRPLSAHPADMSPPTQPDGRSSREKADEVIERTFKTGSQTFEWIHLCADGAEILVEVQLTVIRRGEKPLLATCWRDISERKQLEAELREANRLEAVGRLAGGIAHDFNNLLVVIIANAEFLAADIAEGKPEAEDAQEILSAARRASDLTRQLLAFSRGQPVQPRPTDLDRLVEDLLGLLQSLIGSHIELDFVKTDDPSTVLADPTQLEQIVVNLAANARDAMPRGGRLHIEVGPGAAQDGHAAATGDDGFVVLTMSDSGVGMSMEQLDHAFDPFYTTKPDGRGTGLGLATVHTIAEQNQGHVQIASEPGAGTTVRVFLPRAIDDSESLIEPVRTSPYDGRGEVILVVDDEASIRDLMARELRAGDYEVLTAVDGQDALEQLADNPSIDLLVTDVVMPRMTGPELVHRITRERPDLAVLYISGYSHESDLKLMSELGPARVLQKPFSPRTLRAEIGEILWRRALAEADADD